MLVYELALLLLYTTTLPFVIRIIYVKKEREKKSERERGLETITFRSEMYEMRR